MRYFLFSLTKGGLAKEEAEQMTFEEAVEWSQFNRLYSVNQEPKRRG